MNLWVPFKNIKNHIVLNNMGSNFLLSTGSPITIMSKEISTNSSDYQKLMTEAMMNEKYNVTLNIWNQLHYMKRTRKVRMSSVINTLSEGVLREISDFVGVPIHGLIGTDYFTEIDISIDPLSETIIFCNPRDKKSVGCEERSITMEIETYEGIPVIDLNYNGQNYKAFLDIGSCISYIDRDLIQDLQPVRNNVHDYLPIYGKFVTDIYGLKVAIAGVEVNMDFGVLPPRLDENLRKTGIQFIIGADILKDFALYLSLKGNFLVLNRIEMAPEGTPERWIQKLNATPLYFLVENISVDSIKDEFIGNTKIIEAIEERMSFLSEGSTKWHLLKLLKKVRGEE